MKSITTTDLLFIERIFKVDNSIEKLFKTLCELEIKNQKDSLEYKKTLDYLDIALSSENELYNNYSFSSESCMEMIDFIILSMLSTKTTSDLENASSLKFENSPARRIVNVLNRKSVMSYRPIESNLTSDGYEMSYIADLQNIIFNSNLLSSYMLEDLVNAILVFNEDEINNQENINYRDNLIKLKYYLAYVYKYCGDELIKKQFQINNRVLDNTSLFAYLINLSSVELSDIKRSFFSKTAVNQITRILNVKNKNELLIRKSILRSLLMLMNEDILDYVNNFFNLITNENISQYHQENIDLIKLCFTKTHSDKNKQISLKLS